MRPYPFCIALLVFLGCGYPSSTSAQDVTVEIPEPPVVTLRGQFVTAEEKSQGSELFIDGR